MTSPSANDLITSLEYHLSARNVAPETTTHYTRALIRFMDWFERPLEDARKHDLERYFTELGRSGLAPATVKWHFAGLRAALKWWASREERPSPMERMPAPRVRETVKDVVRPDAVKSVMKALKGYKLYRDAAAVAVMFDVGLRASEICNLDWKDIDWNEGMITVTKAKNGQVRQVPLNPIAGEALDLWKARRTDKKSPWVFCDTRPGRCSRLTRSGLLQMVKRDFELCGITGISPHDLRHSFATVYMDQDGAREDDLMAIGGWKSESMVRRYARTGREHRAIREFRKRSPLS